MSTQLLMYVMYAVIILFAAIVIAYFILRKKMNKSEYQQIRKLRRGTESKRFSTEVLYQKLYITYSKIPYIKTYINKLRRRLEIINVDDEYATRRDSAKILTKVLAFVIPLIALSIIISHSNYLLMSIILIFELFMIDAFIDRSVDSMDNNLLKEVDKHFCRHIANITAQECYIPYQPWATTKVQTNRTEAIIHW